MYTIEENNEEYNDEYVNNSFWSNNRGLIIKIIIIILCIIVLIWLFKALKTKQNTKDDESIVSANVEKVRLAAEDYFFIEENKNKTVDLYTLKSKGLIDNVVDANNRVCNEKSTNATLTEEPDAYKMTVNLVCSTGNKEELFYYHNNTLACLNCDGKTRMLGDRNIKEEKEEVKEEKVEEEINGGNKDDDYVVPISNTEYYEYSCINWSDWTKTRVSDPYLEERSKTLVQGVKYASETTKTIYGEWSDYTTIQIIPRDDLEVETKVVVEKAWSEAKRSRNVNVNSKNIRILSEEVVNNSTSNSKSCSNGYIYNGKCYSNVTKVGNLTFKEYHSGNYRINNGTCNGLKTIKDSKGNYYLTYIGCEYNELISDVNNVSYINDDGINYKNNIDDMNYKNDSYVIYTYQELISQEVVYYRSRSVEKITEKTDTVYTKDKYEEKYLPEGYVKVPGSEEVYYSYKYATCEK